MVVGEGPVAEDRAARLRDAGAEITVTAAQAYEAGLCRGAFLVFVCTEQRVEEMAADARHAGALVTCHDRPELSDFAMPALARVGPVTLAIATDGRAPALARRLREELGRLLAEAGPELAELVAQGPKRGVPQVDIVGQVVVRKAAP